MRVTSSMYYKSVFTDSSKVQGKLFDVNKQISSGLKIQYAGDDVSTFTETMRLDNEITTLGQIKKSVESGYKMSNQSDVVLNEFETSINRARTLLINAANGTNDETSLDAIAKELRGIEGNFKALANTSINGQYLFSGSAVDTKPISSDGTYNGNDIAMSSFLGSRSQQQFNLTGADLFLGEEKLVKREVTSNVVQTLNAGGASSIAGSSTMAEFMGDVNSPNTHYFYLDGVKSDGSAFKEKISMSDASTVDDLLKAVGNAYGNTTNLNLVNVSLNSSGQIVVADKIPGSSKLDFHMVGATDFSGGGAADVTNIDDLDSATTDYSVISGGAPGLYVKEFMKSGFTQANTVSTANNNIEGLLSDRTEFSVSGSKLLSNVAQINRATNAFATSSTKISEVADISKGTLSTTDDSLDGTQLKLSGTDIGGGSYTVDIDFATSGSTFTIGGNTYDIFNMQNPRVAVAADDMTYQQLMDVMNMVITGDLPTANTSAEYDKAIANSNFLGDTSLSYDGKINFSDKTSTATKATVAIHDVNSGDFALTVDSDGDTVLDSAKASVISFNSNNALTVRDPKTDFFKNLDEMITAVENHKLYPDDSSGDKRNVGIENAIAMMDDLQDHVSRSHALVGAQSNTLTTSLERTQLLETSTMSLRSSVIDTDLAEASLTLTQLSTNFQAMLSTVGKISQLSLVNYL